jgi:uncharacterized protein (TIGR04255 family)
LVGPFKIRGCSVRYINRLEVPGGEEISQSLLTYPEIGKGLPQLMTGFLMRVELMLDGFPDGSLVVVQQHMVPSEHPGKIGIMLDNDFRVPVAENTTEEGVWKLIESLRGVKNKVFVNCLTPAMQERIR